MLCAFPKCGESTLIAHIFRLFEHGGELAGTVEPARALVISEEAPGLWAGRRDELGIADHVELLTRPFSGRPSQAVWVDFTTHVASLVGERGYDDVVVVDTLASVTPADDENSATQTVDAIRALQRITEAGAAVFLIHHSRKKDGTQGQSGRGSNALQGEVDVIMELRAVNPENRGDRRRKIATFSRYSESPTEVALELTEDNEYRSIGTSADASQEDRIRILRRVLPGRKPGLTAREVRAAWPEGGIVVPAMRTVSADLKAGVHAGVFRRTGTGKRGSPYRFRRAAKSIRARSSPLGARIESGQGMGKENGNDRPR